MRTCASMAWPTACRASKVSGGIGPSSRIPARVWFSLGRGLSMIDTGRPDRGSTPAIPHVETLSVDGRAVDVRGAAVRLPAGSQRLTFTYAGLSLSVPERVRFRYRLDGFDSAWSEPVSARETVYTNLGPGPYRFRVMASNSEGEWNSAEAAVDFSIAPRVWQTTWFQLAGIVAIIMGSAGLYRLRMHQVARRLNVRFEERLAERTRIAQDLHDTLLQGFVSASMQLHVVAGNVPPDSPAKPSLDRVLQLMGRVIDEGRNAVRGLRSPTVGVDDLEQAFCRLRQELAVQDSVEFRVIVEGRPRPLHPVIRDEVYRIGREALVNAVRHSGAEKIEVEIGYAAGACAHPGSRQRVAASTSPCSESGREGHWGLSGMRERAERIGARLKVWSRPAAGTEVELVVPGHVAFQSGSPGASHTSVGDQAMSERHPHPCLQRRRPCAPARRDCRDHHQRARHGPGGAGVDRPRGHPQFREHKPDVTLMDLRLPDMSGIDALIAIRTEAPDARIIILTTFEGDVEMQRALEAGARGYLLKSMPPKDLVAAIRQVHAGRKSIPPRGRDAACRALERRSADARARSTCFRASPAATGTAISPTQLFISEETVKVHMKHIMEKLGASDRTQAVAIAIRRGIIQL